MTYHPTSAPRLSGSILYTLIAVFSLTLITACGGGGCRLMRILVPPTARTSTISTCIDDNGPGLASPFAPMRLRQLALARG